MLSALGALCTAERLPASSCLAQWTAAATACSHHSTGMHILCKDQPDRLHDSASLFVYASCRDPQTLEKALSKHEIIGGRALAQRMKASGGGAGSRGSSPSCGSSSGRSSPGVHRGSSGGASPGQGSRVLQGESMPCPP
jgi:hypothetical protein